MASQNKTSIEKRKKPDLTKQQKVQLWKERGVFFLMFIALIVFLLLAGYFSNLSKKKQDEYDHQRIMDELAQLQSASIKEHPELNKNYSIWKNEITKFHDDLIISSETTLGKSIGTAAPELLKTLSNLLDAVETSYIDDTTVANEIDAMIPDDSKKLVYEKYFQTFVKYLQPEVYEHYLTENNSSSN